MPNIVGGSGDGSIQREGGTWDYVRTTIPSGGVVWPDIAPFIGQSWHGPTVDVGYEVGQMFLLFDTSSLVEADVVSVTLRLSTTGSGPLSGDSVLEAYLRPWSTPLDRNDWCIAATLAGLTVVATFDTTNPSSGYKNWTGNLKAHLNYSGITSLVVAGRGYRTNVPPTTAQQTGWNLFEDGSSAWPLLVVEMADKTLTLAGIGPTSSMGALSINTRKSVSLAGIGPSSALGSIEVIRDFGITLPGIGPSSSVGSHRVNTAMAPTNLDPLDEGILSRIVENTFSWQYNDAEGDVQQSWALKRVSN